MKFEEDNKPTKMRKLSNDNDENKSSSSAAPVETENQNPNKQLTPTLSTSKIQDL